MRTAETVLNVIRERGARGLPLEDIYRQLYNRELYLRAYGRLYSNQGAMTKGTTADTVDGMSLAKIDCLIDALRYERFRWTPVRRVNIPKPNGKTRPLGIPTWTDKLLQEVIRMILEAYYEPQFSDRSHGFRPNRGCHTALSEVVTGIPQIKPTFLDITPSGIPSNIIPHSKGVKCGLIRSNSPFSYSNLRPAKPKIPKPLVYAQVSPLGTSFATP